MASAILTILNKLEHTYGRTMLARLGKDHTPFQLLIATALSARAKDEMTEVVARELFKVYPDAESIAKAPIPKLEKLVKRTGFYKIKARRIRDIARFVIKEYGNKVPDSLEKLTAIPGVGRKTANCVLAYAYGHPAIAVDVHVHRISNRLGIVKTKQPEETEFALMKIVPKRKWSLVNDVLVHHGKTICLPTVPKCSECTVFKYCKRQNVPKWK
ncbi:MAG: endonuclease III [Candidatus Woesearchaeota archaeon]